MHKLIAFAAGIAAFLTGCQSPQTTQTWRTVKAVRHAAPAVENRDSAYARELHKTLQHAGVEHKIVAFTFKYTTRYNLDRDGSGTAVIYRDSATPSHPWWLMDERLFSPVWLPDESIERQVGFYLVRPANVVNVEEFPCKSSDAAKRHHDSGKTRKPDAKRLKQTTESESQPEKKILPVAEIIPTGKPQPEAAKKTPPPADANADPGEKPVPRVKPAPSAKPAPPANPADLTAQPKNGSKPKFRKSPRLLNTEDPVPSPPP